MYCLSSNMVSKISSSYEFIKISSEIEEEKLNQCRRYYVSAENKEWICKGCRDSIKIGKIPKLSIENKMGFPEQPTELNLNGMEERLTSPRLTLFQMRDLPCGAQKSVRGNSVNLPIDIAPTVDMLPRTLDNSETIAINFKRRMCYKGCAFKKENIRPAAVWKAVNYLMTHSQMYKDLDIQLDTSWIRNIQNPNDTCQCNEENVENVSQPTDVPSNNEEENNENIDNIEEDEEMSNINRDTMLSAPETVPKELTFAPGEGQHPISVFHDPDAEYLSFPTIFCGERRASDEERHTSVHYTEICKYELRSVDRRVASNVPNMFFKLKKVQMKHVLDRVSLAMRRVKGKGVQAKHVLDDESRARIVRLDEGFYIFRNLRNSPAYLEKRKKDAFAMIRQIGFPSLFISLSAAETKWPELLRAIGQLNDKKTYTDEEIAEMDTQKIFGLIRKDSATVVRYFNHRFNTFLHDVLRSQHNPIGEISDYFWRYEFAKRGAIHVHWFAYLKDAPVYGEDDNDDVIRYYDKIISCSTDVKPEYSEYIKYQIHKHTKSCLRGRRKKCRFAFPQPPMPETTILEPFSKDDEEAENVAKENWKKIKRMLDDFKLGEEVTMTFDEMLHQLNLNLTQYLAAVQTTLVRTKIFFQRRPCEIRVNNYMRNCFQFWRANHDIQPSIDPYGMVKYILSYITKGQKAMSVIMEKACREARNGNMDLKQSVRHMGNAFLNGVETSQEEAACLLLGLPITTMSREVFFINTAPIDERTYVLKSMEDIKKMDPESTDVMSSNILTGYKKRSQKHFSKYTLADFVSEIRITFPNAKAREDYYEANTDDYTLEEKEQDDDGQVLLEYNNGIKFKRRQVPRIIRYVNYNRDRDPENYFRERLMLFYPWKNENTDLKGRFKSFENSYNAKKKQIVPNQKKYERYNDILEEAVEEANANPDSDDEEDDESQQETITNLPDYAYFDPERDERLLRTDIGNDMGLTLRYDNEVDLFGTQMNDEEYQQIMRSLNKKQSEIVIHVMEQVTNSNDKMYIFLEGGAGVGKTQVANALNASINRAYRKMHDEDPSGNYTMVLAPTGIAAYHVKGNTLHSGLHININSTELSSLNGDTLARLQQKYINVKVLFLEEVSMIGRALMKKVNQRLQQIFGTTSNFGNLHVIAIGDFYQMAPVQDAYVFSEHYRQDTPELLAPNLWTSHFHIYSLTEIMRQRDQQHFCQMLNRLRVGKSTEEDITIFQSRTIQKNDPNYDINVRHIFPLRKPTDVHNDKIFNSAKTEKMTIQAIDKITQNVNRQDMMNALATVQGGPTFFEIYGLRRKLSVAIGLIYSISCNLNTEDGLINGATCTLQKIQKMENVSEALPKILWVQFEDKMIGRRTRHQFQYLRPNDVADTWTPIFAITRETSVRNGRVTRRQFPMKPAGATTIHACQGSTYDKICIDIDISSSPKFHKYPLTAKPFLRHAHYVAASRVRSLEGLQIINWHQELITVNEDVQKHLEYLQKEKPLQLCYTPVYNLQGVMKCVFLNTRSLHKHISDVQSSHNMTNADLVILAETQLKSSDVNNDYQLEGHRHIFRNDQTYSGRTRPAHGIIGYVKDGIRVLEEHKYTSELFEAIYVCLHQEPLLQPLQVIGIYVSPQSNYMHFMHNFENFMQQIDTSSCDTVILGDFNMRSVTNQERNYNCRLEEHLNDNYNMIQYIQEPTHNSGSVLDLCFSTRHMNTSLIWNHWSDHLILAVAPRI